jgi:hypothetical protein
MEKELETAKRRLRASSGESDEVCGTEESVAVGGAEDLKVTRSKHDAAHRGTLEARSAGLRLRH